MKTVSLLLGLGLATAAPAAQAQGRQVQLLTFGAAPSAPEMTPEDLMAAAAAAVPETAPAQLEGALAGDFAAMGSPAAPVGMPAPPMVDPAAHIPSAASMVQVPRWMRTGVSSMFTSSPTMSALPLLASTCADAPYRRRFDLPASTEARRAHLYPLIAQIACEAGVPAGLFDALVGQESRYKLGALSPKGAIGLTQLMPGTARYLRVVNPWDPVENLRGGARYLREQLSEFGRVDLALAAYNAGPGRVRSRRAVPPFRETVNYVSTITRAWNSSFSRMATLLPMGSPAVPLPVTPAARSPFRRAQLVSYTSPSTPNPM